MPGKIYGGQNYCNNNNNIIHFISLLLCRHATIGNPFLFHELLIQIQMWGRYETILGCTVCIIFQHCIAVNNELLICIYFVWV